MAGQPEGSVLCYTIVMKIVGSVTLDELIQLSQRMYPNLIKALVDVEKHILAIDAEYHVDLEQMLLERGSAQKDLWGINFHPGFFGTDEFIEFDSMVNLRPSQRNETRGVEDERIRKKIVAIIDEKIVQ